MNFLEILPNESLNQMSSLAIVMVLVTAENYIFRTRVEMPPIYNSIDHKNF